MVGHQLSSALLFGWLPPVETIIAVVWSVGVYLIGKARKGLPWHERGFAPPDGQREPLGHARVKKHEAYQKQGVSTGRIAMRFVGSAVVTLVAGVVLELSSAAIATRVGMSGLVFGATVLAAATALPEVATGMEAIRLHDYQMAFSDILGGNAFLPVLFLVAVLLSGTNVLQVAGKADMYLAGLGILLTVVYLGGLIFRLRRQILRMGIDSACVLILYVLGMVGLLFVSKG
jgi:cation:H+ antiporter